jgi:hypothetical protein
MKKIALIIAVAMILCLGANVSKVSHRLEPLHGLGALAVYHGIRHHGQVGQKV